MRASDLVLILPVAFYIGRWAIRCRQPSDERLQRARHLSRNNICYRCKGEIYQARDIKAGFALCPACASA